MQAEHGPLHRAQKRPRAAADLIRLTAAAVPPVPIPGEAEVEV